MSEAIRLVDDWDYQPKLGVEKIGHHVTREKEHSILLDFLTRRNEGSLLVCGFRGIGKTSSIFGSINDAKEKRKELIPILIKATSIHFEEEKEKKKSLLKELIKSLHKNLKDDSTISKSLKEKTSDLYKKSIASKISDKESSGKSHETEIVKKTNLNLIPAIILLISGGLFFIPELSNHSWLLSLISVGSGVFLAIDYSRKSKNTSSKSVSHNYIVDYDFATLQSEMEDLLEELSKANHKVVFILDEFDKINEPFSIISDLKMLINQGNALFIFITIPDILSQLKNKTDIAYTLFSQILFLKRPLFNEIESFIDEIVFDLNDNIKNNPNYKHLKNYLCYLSHTNFFELYSVIRNLVSYDDNKPILSLELDNSQITKANLQKSIGWVYENKKQDNPSQWESNDQMLDVLYRVTEQMETTPNLQTISIDDKAVSIYGPPVNYGPRDREIIKDLFEFLAKQGYLRKTDDTFFSLIGSLTEFHTDVSGIFVEEQKVFLRTYNDFKQKIVDFANIKTKWIEELGTPFSVSDFEPKWNDIQVQLAQYFDLNTFNEAREIYNKLTSSRPPLIPTEQIHTQTKNLNSIKETLNKFSFTLFSQILSKQLTMNIIINIGDLSQGIFSTLGLENRKLSNSSLQFRDNNKKVKQIALALNPQNDLLNDVKNQGIRFTNIIFCLANEDQVSNYKSSLNITSAPTPFEAEVKNLVYATDEKPKTILQALELPLQNDKLEKIIAILKRIPSN